MLGLTEKLGYLCLIFILERIKKQEYFSWFSRKRSQVITLHISITQGYEKFQVELVKK